MVTLGRNALAVVTWALVVGVVVQVYLAGIGVFKGPENYELHRNFGYLLGIISIALAILAFVARADRRQRTLAVILVVLFILQSVFVAVRTSYPEIAALHPVNGMLIVLITVLFAYSVRRLGGFTAL